MPTSTSTPNTPAPPARTATSPTCATGPCARACSSWARATAPTPAWRQCCAEQLTEAEPGLYRLRPEYRLNLPTPPGAAEPRFVLSGEISSIYKQGGKTRKVHNLLLLPSLHKAEELAGRLEAIGNLHSDGRPILGLSSRDLFAIALECCPETIFLPAHIWTPHFSMFGAFSGFSSIEECFLDLAPLIRAAETGLSSDPA